MSRLALAALLAALVAGCGGESSTDGNTVVAAFYPLAWAAGEVAGADVEVVNLTPPGAEPHDVELSPRDVERVRDADTVFYLGGGFMPALEEAVEGHEHAVDLLDEGTSDPHVWLDPLKLATVAAVMAVELGEPSNVGALADRLLPLHEDFRRGLRRCARRELVTTHAAFGHLARRYGLEQLSLAGTAPEAEPSPRELEELIERVRESGATTVFAEPLVSDEVAQTVAREVGAEVAVLDPLEGLSQERLDAGEDYVSVMRDNLAALREALGCR